jgi:hypothetical protein
VTLVLNCVTPDYVFQVSDRQLVRQGPLGGWSVEEEESNKAVLIDGRVAFGYTGLAQIDGKRADRWLAETAADGPTTDMSAVLARIRDHASDAFRRLHLPPRAKRHAFLGTGWVTGAGGQLVPASLLASNALRDGKWLEEAEDKFFSTFQLYDDLPDGFELRSAGVEVSVEHQPAVWRFIRRSAKRSAGPDAFVRSLIIAMDWLANRYPTIGRGLMVLALPRVASIKFAETGRSMALLGPPLKDHTTFAYMPSRPGPLQLYGPHYVSGGMAVMDFTVVPYEGEART